MGMIEPRKRRGWVFSGLAVFFALSLSVSAAEKAWAQNESCEGESYDWVATGAVEIAGATRGPNVEVRCREAGTGEVWATGQCSGKSNKTTFNCVAPTFVIKDKECGTPEEPIIGVISETQKYRVKKDKCLMKKVTTQCVATFVPDTGLTIVTLETIEEKEKEVAWRQETESNQCASVLGGGYSVERTCRICGETVRIESETRARGGEYKSPMGIRCSADTMTPIGAGQENPIEVTDCKQTPFTCGPWSDCVGTGVLV